jgi:hypothetical protein
MKPAIAVVNMASGEVALVCNECDEYGAVDAGDVSYGDYMQAEMHMCPHCDGTKVPKCCYCRKPATVKDEDDYLCGECRAAEQAA